MIHGSVNDILIFLLGDMDPNCCLPPECQAMIQSYRNDPEALLNRMVTELNEQVAACATVRFFRPQSSATVVSWATRLWREHDGAVFPFYMALQDDLVQWITNVGCNIPFNTKQTMTESLCLFLLNWFRDTNY